MSYFLTTKEVEKEFEEISKVKGNEIPDYVILGDFRDNWDVERLNTAFKYVLKGAKLLGTQGNRYFLDRNGEPVIDTGSFIQMIAYATNISPKIFGKPSKEYFLQAVRKINLPLHELVVIGDDLESDIQGAINSSIKGILVKALNAETPSLVWYGDSCDQINSYLYRTYVLTYFPLDVDTGIPVIGEIVVARIALIVVGEVDVNQNRVIPNTIHVISVEIEE